jgi:hypothetical protein
MRPEEVFTLQAMSLRLSDRFLNIERGKTSAARRRVDLTDAAVPILSRRVAVAVKLESPYLFPCEADAKRPLPDIQSAHSRALSASGVAAFRPYDPEAHLGHPGCRSRYRPRDTRFHARP